MSEIGVREAMYCIVDDETIKEASKFDAAGGSMSLSKYLHLWLVYLCRLYVYWWGVIQGSQCTTPQKSLLATHQSSTTTTPHNEKLNCTIPSHSQADMQSLHSQISS